MAVKQFLHDKLFANLTIREAAKGFVISLRSSGGVRPGSVKTLENALGLLATYADEQDWPGLQGITTCHLEEYLAYLQVRPKWFGEHGDPNSRLSQSHVEGQYRRNGRFFNWCVERGHRESNPLDLIPHPKIDEKTVTTISEHEVSELLRYIDYHRYGSEKQRFRATRDRALILLFWATPGRRAELAGLTMGDVDLDRGGILVMGKGGRERSMPIAAWRSAGPATMGVPP